MPPLTDGSYLAGVVESLTPNIPGIEHTERYWDLTMDKEKYRNKRVLILGAGNSAFETADHLADTAGIVHVYSRRPLRHAWDTHFVGDVRAVNNNIIDMYALKVCKINAAVSHDTTAQSIARS